MTKLGKLARLGGLISAVPPLPPGISLGAIADDEEITAAPTAALQPISAFICIIEYKGAMRRIYCRRYDRRGELAYVGAFCETAGDYRQFRCDRIAGVFDAGSGELLGSGDFFESFAVHAELDPAASWGLARADRILLTAGLNILAFMARCDGVWHPLEAEVIESFVCSLWLRGEWAGEPPLAEIIAHSHRLAPDADDFFAALALYAQDVRVGRILRRAIGELIAADGIICDMELEWGAEIDRFFRENEPAPSAPHGR